MVGPLSSVVLESIKKWVTYWRKFKRKRVRIWLSKGEIHFTKKLPRILFNVISDEGGTVKMSFPSKVEGTISDIVERPFGIILKDISSTESETENVEMMFIPMSEISRIDFLKKEKHQLHKLSPNS